MSRPGFAAQFDVLVERNIAVWLGSWGSLFVAFAQPVVIGAFVGLAWNGVEATATTYFVLTISAIYLGCMNACTSLVKERAIYRRERMSGLNVASYLASKLSVLSVLGAAQILLLLIAQAQGMIVPDGMLRPCLIFLMLWLTSCAATSLGLLISAFASSVQMAVIAVPIVMLPQIIFSEAVLGSRVELATVAWFHRATLSAWGFDALIAVTGDWEWSVVLGAPLVLLSMVLVMVLVTAGKLGLD